MNEHINDPDELLTVHGVAALLGVKAWTVYSYRRNPLMEFPAAIHLTEKTVRYRRGDILDWVASRAI